jgi:hypothetical protein
MIPHPFFKACAAIHFDCVDHARDIGSKESPRSAKCTSGAMASGGHRWMLADELQADEFWT